MKKNTKYSVLIAAALLAVTPVAINNLSNNDGSIVVKADTVPETGKDAEHAYTVESTYDSDVKVNETNKVRMTSGLTDCDITDWLGEHVQFTVSGKSVDQTDENEQDLTIRNKDGNDVAVSGSGAMQMQPGYKLSVSATLAGAKPNTWYKWKLRQTVNDKIEGNSKISDPVKEVEKRFTGGLPKNVNSIFKEENKPDGIYVKAKTDKFGEFPEASSPDKDEHGFTLLDIDLGSDQMTQPVIFEIVDTNYNGSDAIDIPHNPEYVGKPADVITENGHDEDVIGSDSTDVSNSIDDHELTSEDSTVDNGTDFVPTPLPELEKPKEIQSPVKDIPLKANKAVMLIKDAFVYNGKGEAVRYKFDKNHQIVITKDEGNYLLKRKYDKITISAKRFMNNHWFYKIADDQYVRANDVGKRFKIQKIKTHGTIKASKKHKVRLYKANGQYAKKYLAKTKKNVYFDKKMFVKNSVFYHIKVKGENYENYWVRKSSIKF